MTVTLLDACQAVSNRKQALGITNEMESIGEERMRLLMGGFDIEPGHAEEALEQLTQFNLNMLIHAGLPPFAYWLSGVWVDGLLTGMILMKLRYEEEQRERAEREADGE